MSLKMLNVAFASLVLTVSGFANAGLIVEENFETDGLNTRYTAEGAGGAGLGCCQNWSLNSQDEGNESDAINGVRDVETQWLLSYFSKGLRSSISTFSQWL